MLSGLLQHIFLIMTYRHNGVGLQVKSTGLKFFLAGLLLSINMVFFVLKGNPSGIFSEIFFVLLIFIIIPHRYLGGLLLLLMGNAVISGTTVLLFGVDNLIYTISGLYELSVLFGFFFSVRQYQKKQESQ